MRPKRTHLELVSGRYLDYTDPQPEDICVEDIATGLSNQCRWTGQCPHFYSIAEHAVLVHDIVKQFAIAEGWDGAAEFPVLLWGALHHDDHEAFVCDIPTPLKNLLGPTYYDVVTSLDDVIGAAMGVSLPWLWFRDPLVKRADALALFIEADRFKVSHGEHWEGRPVLVELPASVTWACGLSPAEAREAYLDRHAALDPPRS